MKINRKEFIRSASTGLAGTATLCNLPFFIGNKEVLPFPRTGSKIFHESARDIPIVDETDVIVCGGGPAGFGAALSAARTGASVRLFEMHGCLGGVWTAGMQAWIFDIDKPGIPNEITMELDRRGARRGSNIKQYVYEIEEMKLLLEDKCVESGVKLQLFTSVVGAYKDDNNRLTIIITESKSGREAWKAKVFIDATGDGDLGALAGNGWDYGYKDTGLKQPMTFMSLISVKDPKVLSEYISFYGGDNEHRKRHMAFYKELNRAGMTPSYQNPTLFQVRDNLIALMINHEYGMDPFNAAQLTAATVSGRSEVNKVVRALRNLGGKWDGIQLVASNEQIGIREGRRIHGRYTVSETDVTQGVRHEDAIAHVTFGIDIHSPTQEFVKEPDKLRKIIGPGLKSIPYDIPIRALIAKDVDGLLMAGRCISGDFIAHSSYRVTGNAVAMGQAAGTLGAISAHQNQLPHQINWNDIKKALEKIYEISSKRVKE